MANYKFLFWWWVFKPSDRAGKFSRGANQWMTRGQPPADRAPSGAPSTDPASIALA